MEMCTKRFKIDRVNAPAICFTTLVIYSQAVTHIAHMLLTVISIIPKYICILCMTLAKSLINKNWNILSYLDTIVVFACI